MILTFNDADRTFTLTARRGAALLVFAGRAEELPGLVADLLAMLRDVAGDEQTPAGKVARRSVVNAVKLWEGSVPTRPTPEGGQKT